MKQQIEHWVLDRPYSVLTSATCGGVGALLTYVWMPLFIIGPLVWLGLLVYVLFACSMTDRHQKKT